MSAGTETITINGEPVITLKEFLRPGLRAVFIGFNPAPTSVAAGHYYQGKHGRRLWARLQKYGVMSTLPQGAEDVAAFNQGFGFADLVRRPTGSAGELNGAELNAGVDDLAVRLKRMGNRRPLLVFVYKEPWKRAAARLTQEGFSVLRMPSPYEPPEALMQELILAIRTRDQSSN